MVLSNSNIRNGTLKSINRGNGTRLLEGLVLLRALTNGMVLNIRNGTQLLEGMVLLSN